MKYAGQGVSRGNFQAAHQIYARCLGGFRIFLLRPWTGPLHELSGACRFLLRRRHSGGDRILSVEAQAGGETGFEHAALAEVPFGNSSQRTVSTAASELAAGLAD